MSIRGVKIYASHEPGLLYISPHISARPSGIFNASITFLTETALLEDPEIRLHVYILKCNLCILHVYIQVTLTPQDEEEQVKEAKKQEMDNNETSDKILYTPHDTNFNYHRNKC